MSHVFISYIRDDQALVDRICEELKSRGVEVWLDRTSIRPGQRWKDAIRTAISEGSFFLACFSNSYASRDSTYMNEELTLAIDELRLKSFRREWFIPVLLSECDVPARSIGGGETLLDLQWLDLYTDFVGGLSRLVLALRLDEVNRLRDLIDEFGSMYVARIGDHRADGTPLGELSSNRARRAYLESVDRLKREFGVTYDPIRITK